MLHAASAAATQLCHSPCQVFRCQLNIHSPGKQNPDTATRAFIRPGWRPVNIQLLNKYTTDGRWMISPSLGKTLWLVEYLLFIALNSGFRCFIQSSQHDGLYSLVRGAFFIFSLQLCARIADSYCSPCCSCSSPPLAVPFRGRPKPIVCLHRSFFPLELLLPHHLSSCSFSPHL